MSDEQDRAEALDDDELGDNPFVSEEMPGEDFVPEHWSGARASEFAADGSIVEDDVASRSRREDSGRGADPVGIELMSENELDEFDEEAELIGDAGDDPANDAAAEVAAVHIISAAEARRPIQDED